MEILLVADGVVFAQGAHFHADRNHLRFLPEHAHNPAVPVLVQRAHNLGGVSEFVRLECRREHHQHLALAHRHVHRAEIEERMTEGQHALAVVISDRAYAGDAHVAVDQHSGNHVPGLERILPTRGGFVRIDRTAAAALHGGDAHLLEHRSELAKHVVIEAGKSERRFDGHHHRRLQGQIRRSAGGHRSAQQSRRNSGGFFTRTALIGSACIGRPRLVEIVDLEHQLDRRDAADRIGGKDAEAQGYGADQLAIDVNRTTAHPASHVGARGLAAHLRQDDVLARSPLILPEADNLDRHGLGLAPLEDCPGIAFHSRL